MVLSDGLEAVMSRLDKIFAILSMLFLIALMLCGVVFVVAATIQALILLNPLGCLP